MKNDITSKKQFSPIKLSDSEFVTSNENILTECVTFYKNLYVFKSMTSNQNNTTFFSEHEDERAIHELIELIEGALTEKGMPRGTQRYGSRIDLGLTELRL